MFKSCCSCCPWKQRQYPIFDYDEIDDLEFENLLSAPGTGPFQTQNQPPSSFWTTLASLFGVKSNRRGYEAIPSYNADRIEQDVLYGQEDLHDAQLLTQEQVSNITSKIPLPPKDVSLSNKLFIVPESNSIVNTKTEHSYSDDPLNIKQLEQNESIETRQELDAKAPKKPVLGTEESEGPEIFEDAQDNEEVFNPDLLAKLTKTPFS